MAHVWTRTGGSTSKADHSCYECTECAWKLQSVPDRVLQGSSVDEYAAALNTPSCEDLIVFNVLES